MKKLILFILIVCVVSCSKEDLKDSSLEGEWILTKVSCYCGFGQDYDFSTSKVRFNTEENKITIENKGEFSFLRESGTYNYSGNDNRISFDDNSSYIFRIEGTTLYLSFIDEPGIADDEVNYTYIKN